MITTENIDPRSRSWLLALLHLLITIEPNIIEELHRCFGNFLGVLAWDNNHTVAVCHHDIPRTDKHTAQVDRSIYRFDFVPARTESAPFSFVIGGHFMSDDLVAVCQTSTGDHTYHSQLLPVQNVSRADAPCISIALCINHQYASRKKCIHERFSGDVVIPVL